MTGQRRKSRNQARRKGGGKVEIKHDGRVDEKQKSSMTGRWMKRSEPYEGAAWGERDGGTGKQNNLK